MAVRASDRITLAVLATPSYVRQYYLLQSSTLNPPAAPTANPPAAPWSTTEPAYTAGSTNTLYTVMLTAWGDTTFEYGPVQKSSAYEAAKQAYNLAQSAQTAINGATKVIHGITDPGTTAAPDGSVYFRHAGALTAPVDGQWTRVLGTWVSTPIDSEVIANLDVGKLTAGSAAIADLVAQKIAAASGQFLSLDVAQLIAGDATISEAVIQKLFTDVVMARMAYADSFIGRNAVLSGIVDGQTIRGAYIEGPNIASSAAVGEGVNVLNDPGFTSALDTAWVASGYLGTDAIPTQTDTITWNQVGVKQGNKRVRFSGSVVARMSVKPLERRTRELLHTHASSIFNSAARTISNPYTYRTDFNSPSALIDEAESKSLASVGLTAAATTRSSRTTYLTNSAVVAVTAGESWQASIRFNPMGASAPNAQVWMQLINASTSTVVWEQALTEEERRLGGQVIGQYAATATANLRFRLKATYTSAGDKVTRIAPIGSGSYRRAELVDPDPYDRPYERSVDGFSITPWVGDDLRDGEGSFSGIPVEQNALEIYNRARTRFTLTGASLGTRSPEAGFTLKARTGLELYDSNGAVTARLNGWSNFLAGTFATGQSGERIQMSGQSVIWYGTTGAPRVVLDGDDVISLKEAITPATASKQGVIRLATQAEVDAGVETEVAVSPATLAGRKVSAVRQKQVSQNFPTGAWTIVTWPTAVSLSGITYASSGVFTIVTPGLYLISAQLAFVGSNTTGQRTIRIEVNGNQAFMSSQIRPTETFYPDVPTLTTAVSLAAGDTIAIGGFQSSGGTIGTDPEAGKSFFSIARL